MTTQAGVPSAFLLIENTELGLVVFALEEEERPFEERPLEEPPREDRPFP